MKEKSSRVTSFPGSHRQLAVANITPGPNGLYLVVAGYFVAGLKGAGVATAALMLPPVLVLPLERAHVGLVHLGRFRAVMFALSLSVIALLAISAGSLAVHAGSDWLGVAMILFGAAALLRKAPPFVAFILAGLTGWALR